MHDVMVTCISAYMYNFLKEASKYVILHNTANYESLACRRGCSSVGCGASVKIARPRKMVPA